MLESRETTANDIAMLKFGHFIANVNMISFCRRDSWRKNYVFFFFALVFTLNRRRPHTSRINVIKR